jgi:hypothetical protein
MSSGGETKEQVSLPNEKSDEKAILNWVKVFLLQPEREDSDHAEGGNHRLWEHIKKRIGTFTVELREMNVESLVPVISPRRSKELTPFKEDNERYDERIESLCAAMSAKDSVYVPAPLISTNFWNSYQTLADGNHRRAAMIKLKIENCQTIIFTACKEVESNESEPPKSKKQKLAK